MTDETLPQLPPPPPATPKPRHPRVWPLWLLSLLILIAIGVLAWSGWQQLQLRQQSLNQLQSTTFQQQELLQNLEQRYQQRLNSLDQKMDQSSEELHRLDKQLSYTSHELLSMGAKGRTDWLFAEAEYLLRLANQRLRMERDAGGARAILEAADQVLAETDDIAVYPVRQQIAKEVLALQSVTELDRTGIFLKLEALGEAIPNLQPRDDQERLAQARTATAVTADAQAQEGSAFKAALHQLWSEVKQLVVIRRTDTPMEPLLPPESAFFLQQNLRLMLEQAELALLQKNQALYDRSLKKSQDWVQQYFQGDAAATAAVNDQLSQLRQLQVDPNLPDISSSLRLLKSLLSSINQASPGASPSKSLPANPVPAKPQAPTPEPPLEKDDRSSQDTSEGSSEAPSTSIHPATPSTGAAA